MGEYLIYATPVFMAIVAIILGLGLWNMMRGGSVSRSQTLMRYRVAAQAVAVVVMVAAVYFAGRG